MERRILDALAERGSVRTGFGWRSLVPVWGGTRVLVWGAGMAGLAVLALVIPAVRRARRVSGAGDWAAAFWLRTLIVRIRRVWLRRVAGGGEEERLRSGRRLSRGCG